MRIAEWLARESDNVVIVYRDGSARFVSGVIPKHWARGELVSLRKGAMAIFRNT